MSRPLAFKSGPPPAVGVAHDVVEIAYRSYWDELCRYVRKVFGAGPPEPEEVAQTAFARFAGLERPQEVANPRAFLYRCARNIVFDHHRREEVRDRYLQAQMPYADDDPVNPDGERVLSGRQRLAIVDATVRAMRPQRRKVLIMHAIHGLNYSEIARRLALSPTRVTQLFAAAVAECERALREADGDATDGTGGRQDGR